MKGLYSFSNVFLCPLKCCFFPSCINSNVFSWPVQKVCWRVCSIFPAKSFVLSCVKNCSVITQLFDFISLEALLLFQQGPHVCGRQAPIAPQRGRQNGPRPHQQDPPAANSQQSSSLSGHAAIQNLFAMPVSIIFSYIYAFF